MILIAKWIVIFFGVFLVLAGVLMLFKPANARQLLQKAGSTNLINYAEITLRMIPAAGLIGYAAFSKYPLTLQIFGWFMLLTSLVLYAVPRRLHHQFSLKAAGILIPLYFQLAAPFAWLAGAFLVYAVW